MKKTIAVALLLVLALSSLTIFAADKTVNISVNGAIITFPDAQPFIDENDRTQVPIGALAEILGIETSWNGNTQTATFCLMNGERYGDYVRITIGKNELAKGVFDSMTMTGGEFYPDAIIEIDTAAILKDDRVFVPVRYVAECLNFTVEWDSAASCVNLVGAKQVNFDVSLLQYMPTDKNYMLSPFSLKMALAMAANGADGATKNEMLSVLGIDDLAQFNSAAKDFIENSNKNEAVSFNIANSIWLNSDYYKDDALDFSDTYKGTVSDYFLGTADKINNANGAKTINDWVSNETMGKIENVINDDMVKDCLSFLVNTIYFKGDWASPFAAEATYERIFNDRNGNEKTTAFMHQTGYYSYYEDTNISMLAKPYKDENIKMYFVLPNPAKSAQKVHYMEPYMFDDAINNMESVRVNFSVPKFKTEYLHENLIEILQEMGINTAFNPNLADFLGMYSKKPNENIYIKLILQKTFIEVDEKGTEAAAATVIGGGAGSAQPPKTIDFTCDRPFTYFIRNDATGDILFIGEYAFVE